MNITIPFEVEVSGTGTSTFTKQHVQNRLLTLKGKREQDEETRREIEFLEKLRDEK